MNLKVTLHPKTKTQLDTLMQQPTGSAIFHGPRGLGKHTTARELAVRLNCLGDSSGPCTNCLQIQADNYPDLITIGRGDKASITIEQVRNLTGNLSLQPYNPVGTRLVIIDEAHLLTPEAQNALLKLLEEPPPRTLIILATERLEAMLLTVRSRCRMVHFVRVDEAGIQQLLTNLTGISSETARQAVIASGGAPGLAVTLAQHPAEIEALQALTHDASGANNQTLFSRLLLANRLIASNADLERFGAALHGQIILNLKHSKIAPNRTSLWLNALERFRRQLAAKVSPRVALERLMLELG